MVTLNINGPKISVKKQRLSQHKGSTDKGSCHQDWWPNFNPQAPHGGKKNVKWLTEVVHTT